MDNVDVAVRDLIELIDANNYDKHDLDNPRFIIHKILIEKTNNGWAVGAYNFANRCFKYTMYVDHRGNIVADGS